MEEARYIDDFVDITLNYSALRLDIVFTRERPVLHTICILIFFLAGCDVASSGESADVVLSCLVCRVLSPYIARALRPAEEFWLAVI